MITYEINNIYHARLQLGSGLNRKTFYGSGFTRDIAMALAMWRAGLLPISSPKQ